MPLKIALLLACELQWTLWSMTVPSSVTREWRPGQVWWTRGSLELPSAWTCTTSFVFDPDLGCQEHLHLDSVIYSISSSSHLGVWWAWHLCLSSVKSLLRHWTGRGEELNLFLPCPQAIKNIRVCRCLMCVCYVAGLPAWKRMIVWYRGGRTFSLKGQIGYGFSLSVDLCYKYPALPW